MAIYHLTFATDGRLPLFTDEASRRRAVRRIAAVAGASLLLFYVVDDHIHVVVESDEKRLGRLSRALLLRLRGITEGKIEPARRRAVENRSHLWWLVRYVLGQGPHHDLPHDPALWSGSCFQDLVGARCVPGLALRERLELQLPRLKTAQLLEIVKLPSTSVAPASNELLFTAGLERLIAAAADACAAGPGVATREAAAVEAKTTVTHLAQAVGYSVPQIAAALSVHPQTVRRLARSTPPEGAIQATRVRFALVNAVDARRTAEAPRASGPPVDPPHARSQAASR